uniref:Translin-associated factor X-interacting protein 1 N-terminal domain-containing protein n=1 Tax=Athene cunicularia TaxID=194338 RepID=A0A663MRL6_ATHCN
WAGHCPPFPCCHPVGSQLPLNTGTQTSGGRGRGCRALLTIPKPRYLKQLESYLRKELQSLDLTEKSSQELKLQPYREIFESFIEDFKTYKPLLTAIKNEYEKKTIHALEPLKAMVTTVSEECSQQILAMQEKEKDEINMLKQEKQHLLKIIDNMKEENNSLQTQVEHLQTSVAEEYTCYVNEHSARKLLLAKLSNLHNEQRDKTCPQVQDVKGEDVVKLTLALKIARQDLTKAQLKMNTIIADYRDVVPRKHFESLEKKKTTLIYFRSLSCTGDAQEQCHFTCGISEGRHTPLHKEYEILCLEICIYNKAPTGIHTKPECVGTFSTAQRVFAVAEVIPGGAEQWGCLAEGKTSDELVDVLLEEIGTGLLKQINAFPGQGKGDNVPVYLRHEGEVKNKKLTKKDMVNILKDVWKEKIALEWEVGPFFLSYLQRKHGDAAFQWSYTLHENMRLCRSNHDEEGNTEPFVAKLRSQYVREKQEYLSQLKTKLGDLIEVRADDLKSAFCVIDPGISDQMLDTYLDLAYQSGREQPDQEALPVETALERLLAGDVRRAGPPPREGGTPGCERE